MCVYVAVCGAVQCAIKYTNTIYSVLYLITLFYCLIVR